MWRCGRPLMPSRAHGNLRDPPGGVLENDLVVILVLSVTRDRISRHRDQTGEGSSQNKGLEIWATIGGTGAL